MISPKIKPLGLLAATASITSLMSISAVAQIQEVVVTAQKR